MRKIIVLEHITLDGVIQAPGGPDEDTSGGFTYGGWIAPYAGDLPGTTASAQMGKPFDLLLGRKTFEIWAPYWPQHPEDWPGVNTATKFVASNTMSAHEWGPNVFLNGDVAEKVAQIKQQPGPDLNVWGSSELLQTLIKHDLVDAFWLVIYPVTLGVGKRLFADGTIPMAFKVTKSEVTPKGIVIVNYERAGTIPPGSA